MKARDYLFRFPYCVLIIFAVILLVYSQILTFNLGKLDEYNILIVNMDLLRDFSNLKEALLTNPFFHKGGEFYRPLQNLSFMMDAHLSGDSDRGFYLSNLIIHAVTCSLIWYLLALLGSEKRIALLLSLFYAVHPLFVQTVAWAPSRGDMLITFFGLLSFIMFIRYIRTGRWWYLMFHIIAYGFALFSKESAILIPVLCYLYFFFIERKKKPSNAGLVIAVLCYFFLIGLFFYIRNEVVQVTVPKSQIGIAVLLQNSRALPEFIFKFFIPAGLTPMPAFNWAFTILGLVFLIILCVAAFRTNKDSFRFFLFGAVWFLLFAVPALVYINKYGSASCDYMEHRAYLPLIGMIIFMGKWLSEKADGRLHRFIPWSLLLVIFIFGAYTAVYAKTYKDGGTYFDRAVQQNPGSAIAWYCRGTILIVEKSNYRLAIADLEKSLKLLPDYPQAYLNRGFCREQMNDIPGAVNDYRMAAKLSPSTYEPHAALAFLFTSTGKKRDALLEYDSAIALNPAFLEGFYRRAMIRMESGDFSLALDDLNEVIRLNEKYPDAYANRGIVKFQLQDYQGALDDLSKALMLNDQSAETYLNRGRVYFWLKKDQNARSDWEKAARLGNKEAETLLEGVITNNEHR